MHRRSSRIAQVDDCLPTGGRDQSMPRRDKTQTSAMSRTEQEGGNTMNTSRGLGPPERAAGTWPQAAGAPRLTHEGSNPAPSRRLRYADRVALPVLTLLLRAVGAEGATITGTSPTALALREPASRRRPRTASSTRSNPNKALRPRDALTLLELSDRRIDD